MDMSERKGFQKGIQAMRELLISEFDKQASGSFEGYEIARLIAQAPGPKIEEESPKAKSPS